MKASKSAFTPFHPISVPFFSPTAGTKMPKSKHKPTDKRQHQKIPASRLALAEDYAAVICGKVPYPSCNPPTDPLVIACLNELGRGWPDDQRLMLGNVDITADLRIVFDELEKLNAPRDEFEAEPTIDRDAIRAVGIRLNEIGGIDAMRAAAEALYPMAGARVSRLDCAWDGIGDWKW